MQGTSTQMNPSFLWTFTDTYKRNIQDPIYLEIEKLSTKLTFRGAVISARTFESSDTVVFPGIERGSVTLS